MNEYRIHLRKHIRSDLLMAYIEEFPGFVVHAYSDKELEAKLPQAFKEYMDATGNPVTDVEVYQKDSTPDFWPPAFVARASLERAA